MMSSPPTIYSKREWRYWKDLKRGVVHMRGFDALALAAFEKQPMKPTGTHCGHQPLLYEDFVATKPIGTNCPDCLLWFERCEGLCPAKE